MTASSGSIAVHSQLREAMDNADKAIRNAEAIYRSRDYEGAALLLAPLAAGLDNADAMRLLAMCRLRMRAPNEALALMAHAEASAPDDARVALNYGIVLQNVGRHQEAVSKFRAALKKLTQDPAPPVNLANSLLALGDVQGAIAAARKGRLRGPNMPQAHSGLGRAYLAGGFFEKAAECFRVSIRLAQDFADGWVGLGVAQYRMGKIHAAKQAMRAALRAAPGHPVAAANLGAFLRLTGEVEASEALLRGVIAAHPQASAARINLVADLLQDDRAAEALALMGDETLPPGAIDQEWALQKILALIKLERRDEAQIMLDGLEQVVPSLAPLLHWQQVLLAADTAAAKQAATAAEAAMEAAVEVTDMALPEHRIVLHSELATFWSMHDDADRAFSHWIKGHRLMARFQPFSRAAFAEFIDASIDLFSAARLAQGARAANSDGAPVFIVGMPRSGTTLAEQILAAHGQVDSAGERAALGEAFLQLGGTDNATSVARVARREAMALDEYATGYLADWRSVAPYAVRIVDKMPGNFRYLGLMSLLMPGARVIACERDPRDIGLSIFTKRFNGVHPYANDLSDLGWYIGQQQRLMAHWRAALPNPMMTVQLTDWVEDFSATLRRVLDFLELQYDPSCERFYQSDRQVRTASRTQVREKVNARGIGRWRRYSSQLSPLIDGLRESGALQDT